MSLTPASSSAFNDKPTEKQKKKAIRIAQKTILMDGHKDLPFELQIKNFKLQHKYLGVPIETKDGDFDYVMSKKGA